MDPENTACPFYGSRRITAWLVSQGEAVNRKRVQRLLRLMGLEAIYPKPRLNHKVYPYLLRDVAVKRVDQVWSADITYLPLPGGFMYLAATIDWYSRYVLAWRLVRRLDGSLRLGYDDRHDTSHRAVPVAMGTLCLLGTKVLDGGNQMGRPYHRFVFGDKSRRESHVCSFRAGDLESISRYAGDVIARGCLALSRSWGGMGAVSPVCPSD